MDTSKKMKLTVDLYVRLPASIHADIKALAEKEHRSLNAQVIALVQEALAHRSRPHPAGASASSATVPAGAAYVERNVALPTTDD